MAKKKETRGERNIRWIETHCIVPAGKYVGKNVTLRDWQKGVILGIYDQPTRRAIVSFGRKNGKTALAAMLLLLHLIGPEARPNSELYSSALSRDQAAIVFRLASKMVRLNPHMMDLIHVRDTAKQLWCEHYGTLYQALSAEASTNFGLSPVFLVHDELGQVRGSRHPLYEALETATGAQENPLSVVISTQAPTDRDLLSVLIDDAKAEFDARVRLFLWAADEEDDPFDEATIRKANPAFGEFQDRDEVLGMAEDARRMPTREAEFRNLVLNQRVEAASAFVTKSVWEANGGSIEQWGPVYAGLDLSETGDLTAFVMVSPVRGVIGVRPVFWLPNEGLPERSRRDRVQYDVWHEQGFLETTPGHAVEYEYVAERIAQLFAENDIRKVAFDRWNMKHLRPWLIKAGFTDAFIENRFVDFGQGFQSMHPALHTLEGSLLNGRLRHEGHPVLTMCASNAVVKGNEAGWRKLDKRTSNGRIDGLVALAMAVGLAGSALHEDAVYPVALDTLVEADAG